jgi:hypothetical protein
MNYNWNKKIDQGQYENGFVEAYETIVNNNKALAIITYLPQYEDKEDKNIVLTLILEGEKENWTEGTVKNIFFDVEDRVKEVESFKFRVFSSLDFMMTQIFFTEKIHDFKYLNSGEFTFNK